MCKTRGTDIGSKMSLDFSANLACLLVLIPTTRTSTSTHGARPFLPRASALPSDALAFGRSTSQWLRTLYMNLQEAKRNLHHLIRHYYHQHHQRTWRYHAHGTPKVLPSWAHRSARRQPFFLIFHHPWRARRPRSRFKS